MKKMFLNILAGSMFTTFLAAIALSVLYYRVYLPIKQQLPDKVTIQRLNDNLEKVGKQLAELEQVKKQPNDVEQLKKEVVRLEKMKEQIKHLTTEKP